MAKRVVYTRLPAEIHDSLTEYARKHRWSLACASEALLEEALRREQELDRDALPMTRGRVPQRSA